MTITTAGLDIAKQVIQVHAVDVRGKPVIRKALKRHQVLPFFWSTPSARGFSRCPSGGHEKIPGLAAYAADLCFQQWVFLKPFFGPNTLGHTSYLKAISLTISDDPTNP